MRAMLTAVVLPSLLIAAVVGAQPAKGGATTGAGAGSGAAAGSAAAPAAPTGAGAGAGSAAAPAPVPAASAADLAAVKPEDMPTAVRMRRLEQKTQALKERAWQLKARLQMLKEQTLGGGVGAQALIAHIDDMGTSFRLTKLIYSLDGTQVFARTDETGDALYKTKSFDVFSGPIAPGNHNLSVIATYRGHGYGVFEYLSKFTFTTRGTASFTTGEGKISKVECHGYEKGGAATPMEKRPTIDCKISDVAPEKPAESGAPTTPGTTPLPPPAAGGTPPAAAPAPAPAPGK